MRYLTGLILLAACALGAGAPTAFAKPAKTQRCPGRGTVVATSRQAIVYIRPESTNPVGPYHQREYLGCIFGRSRAVVLGPLLGLSSTGGSGIEVDALAGTMVAYETVRATGTGSGSGLTSNVLTVIDLRTGRVVRQTPTGTMAAPTAKVVGAGPATSVVVTENGSLAWIVNVHPWEGKYRLHVLDAAGERVLASGPDIAPKSLARVGSTLYWTQGVQAFSSTLR